MAVLVDTLTSVRNQVDRLVPPQTRQNAYDSAREFAYQRPLLFSFLLSQFLAALLPVLLFTSFVFSVVATALVASLLFGTFWIGLAGLVLAAALTVTFGVAVLIWAWGVGGYLAVAFAWGVVFGGAHEEGSESGKVKKVEAPVRVHDKPEEEKRNLLGGDVSEGKVHVNGNSNGSGNGNNGVDRSQDLAA